MSKLLLIIASLLLVSATATAEEAADDVEATEVNQATEDQADGIEGPRTMSGMSILGNEEAPKSLVIIPWKSSELGEDISLSDTLDDRARPVDKEVFLRELSFYEIRSDE
jgi:outer membrane biogenesis lipoprotein LolB